MRAETIQGQIKLAREGQIIRTCSSCRRRFDPQEEEEGWTITLGGILRCPNCSLTGGKPVTDWTIPR